MKIKHLASAAILALGLFSCTAEKEQISGISLENMDLNSAPGTDFFEYACGGWIKNHPMPADYSRYGVTEILDEENRIQIRQIIEELGKGTHQKGSVEQMIGDLYTLLMDSARINKEGISPIKADMQKIEAIKSREEIVPVMSEMGVTGGGEFFGFYIDADMKNSMANLVQLNQGGLTLRIKDYYLDTDEATVKIREAFQKYIVDLFLKYGYDNATSTRIKDNVMSIETRLAKASRSLIEMRDPEKNYNKMSYENLKKDFAGFDWDTYFKANFITELKELSVGQPETIKEAIAMLNDTPIQALKDWMQFKLLNGSTSEIGDEFYDLSFDFFNKTMNGQPEAPARWKHAVNGVNGILGMAVGQMYVKKYFPEENKKRMLELVENLKVALGERIDKQDWMNDETKKLAKEKLATFIVKIGYPDKWKSYEGLTIDPEKSLYDNYKQIAIWSTKDEVARKLNKPVDRSEWGMTPQTVNAYYNPTTNEICFPAGILQPPFFDMAADDAYNYGGIGATIGHEMTHGFDDEGRQYDKDGNLRDWWTGNAAEEFQKRANVLADYYDKIEALPGLFIKGKQTLGENLADHGGLKVAWAAYKNATAKKPLADKDGFTADQRFFLSYAMTWAESIREERIRNQVNTDVHAQAKWRVNGCLPHIDQWYEAFHITDKDPMFIPKAERADVW